MHAFALWDLAAILESFKTTRSIHRGMRRANYNPQQVAALSKKLLMIGTGLGS
jgi:hypothetical protein